MSQQPIPNEGHVSQKQQSQLCELIKQYAPGAKRIMEIGFNAGHSAEGFLKCLPNVKVVSFDIGLHDYVRQAKAYINDKYPGRHTLHIGDSTKIIPEYKPDAPFDVIYIDGGHDYPTAQADFENCRRLAHADTLVIMDDTVRGRREWTLEYNVGPTKAWLEAMERQELEDLGFVDYSEGRGMSWGRYRKRNTQENYDKPSKVVPISLVQWVYLVLLVIFVWWFVNKNMYTFITLFLGAALLVYYRGDRDSLGVNVGVTLIFIGFIIGIIFRPRSQDKTKTKTTGGTNTKTTGGSPAQPYYLRNLHGPKTTRNVSRTRSGQVYSSGS